MANTEIVIPIDDEKAKYISEVISNKSCLKILDFLSENEGTVSEISSELKMPINTVDYNIKKLSKSGLIEKKSFWWSTRGKKMPSYVISNKKIVISPKKRFVGLSKYIFAFVLSGIIAWIIRIKTYSEDLIENNLDKVVGVSSKLLESEGAKESANYIQQKTTDLAVSGAQNLVIVHNPDIWLWFLAGAWGMIFLFFIINLFWRK